MDWNEIKREFRKYNDRAWSVKNGPWRKMTSWDIFFTVSLLVGAAILMVVCGYILWWVGILKL